MKPVPKPSTSSFHHSSPQIAKTGRYNLFSTPLETSASLPAIPEPTTPTRQTTTVTMAVTHKPLSKANNNSSNGGVTTSESLNANKKRVLESPRVPGLADDGRTVKKARTLPLPTPSSPSRNKTNSPNIAPTTPRTPRRRDPNLPVAFALPPISVLPASPTTPKNTKLPTLTELLASEKKSKKAKGKEKSKPLQVVSEPDPIGNIVTADNRLIIVDPYAVGVNRVPHDAHQDLDSDLNPLSMDVNAEINNMDLDVGYVDPVVVDGDNFELELVSPTKSLSSIADSDEEEEDELADDIDGPLDLSFRPQATSTQVQPNFQRGRGPFVSKSNQPPPGSGGNRDSLSQVAGTDSWESVYKPTPTPASLSNQPGASSKNSNVGAPSSSAPYRFGAYNSQFESAVAAQVDRVDKLLERDVDYEGWLKDPDADDNDEAGGAGGFSLGSAGSLKSGGGQNGISYGYGKAFEYDESP